MKQNTCNNIYLIHYLHSIFMANATKVIFGQILKFGNIFFFTYSVTRHVDMVSNLKLVNN